jgi:soluble lytic murein transglycosylase
VRAALRAQEWTAVQAAIEAMPALAQREPAWRYWLARALKAQGRTAQADTLFQGLSGETNFYGLLAAEDLGVLAPPKWDGWHPQRADIDAVLARPALRRAFLLYQVGLPGEGLYEWFSGVRGMDDKELLAAAEAASELGVPDRAMRAAERTVMLHDFSQRYPTPYRELLFASTQQSQLDEAWVYGLIKQESAFVADARSRVGAAGLMQLMPGTAKSMAKRASLKDFKVSRLTDVAINLMLGTQYLRHVLDDLGDAVLATAAYNAGPGRARRWSSEAPLEGAIYAESIPFEETRDYVKKVMANAFYYSSRLGAPKKSLKDMLGIVPGRSDRFRDAIASVGPPQLSANLPGNP